MRIRDKIFPEGTKIRNILRKINTLINKTISSIKNNGIKATIRKIIFSLKSLNTGEMPFDRRNEYEIWIDLNEPKEEELQEQRRTKFKINPKISLLVPMYNTPVNFFEELVDCLINQTYSNWELCLADGSKEKNKELEAIYTKDSRIKYKFLNENKGISGNTNECIKMATGDFIALFDHDDLLPEFSLYEIVKCINENPDVEFIYTDEDKIEDNVKNRFDPYFKSDFAIDTLRANNYICHFSILKKELMDKLEGERTKYDGAQDYDIILRMSEKTNKIVHIPKILYHWRVHKNSTAKAGGQAKPYAFESGIPVLEEHLQRVRLPGTVSHGETLGTYRIKYDVIGTPKVSILIPNKDGKDILKVCIDSIINLTTYKNYEIVIIENNSDEEETFEYYKELEQKNNIRVVYYKDKGFNYSKIINFGVKNCEDSDYIIQLNNDTELLTPEWIEEMLGFAQREDVGAVGVQLIYPDNTIQHAGIIIGIGGVAGHIFRNIPIDKFGYFAKDKMIQNLSAVTAACIMTKKSIYDEVGYMDEKFAVAFNDVDFCLKIRKKEKLIVYNPFVKFKHYESKTRGYEDTPEKVKRFSGEIKRFQEKWKEILKNGDPYYNVNLRLDSDQCAIKQEKINRNS